MLKFFAPYKKFGIFLLILSVIIIYFIYQALNPKRVLPIYDPYQISADLVDPSMQEVRKYHTIKDFKLLSHTGDTVTQNWVKDKIYVVDFFFTTCQTICPIMTKNMGKLQQNLMQDQDVVLLSHTVTPEIDSLAQLQRYAKTKGVNADKWRLVTGSKKELYDLARKSYFVAKENPNYPEALIHTENFTLIDKKGRIRGYYDGTDEEAMYQLLADVELLQQN